MVAKKPTAPKDRRPAPPAGAKDPKSPKGEKKGAARLRVSEARKLELSKNPKSFLPKST